MQPRYELCGPITIAGLPKQFTSQTRHEIPLLWQRLARWVGRIPNQVGSAAFGVIRNNDKGAGFYYLAGFEVEHTRALPDELRYVQLPEQAYAVFQHTAPVSQLFETMCAIYQQWVPTAPVTLEDAPCFERYGEDFDPQTGLGTIEIWLPIERFPSDQPAIDKTSSDQVHHQSRAEDAGGDRSLTQ